MKGEALLEIAIFGAIIIMLLGVLISYGLRYNYQQQAMQQAFRKSLPASVLSTTDGNPDSASSVVVKDIHMPNPSDTFGAGSVNPISGSAGSPTRSYKIDQVADKKSELPRVTMDINGQEISFNTAGFRYEYDVSPDSLDRYYLVYGYNNVCDDPAKNCGAEKELDNCIGDLTEDAEGVPECSKYALKIKILDYCAGQIVDYGTAVKQCRMIVDNDACETECLRSNDVTINCSKTNGICSKAIKLPWYCKNFREINAVSHEYIFPLLYDPHPPAGGPPAGLFASSPLQSMGLQQDYNQTVKMDKAALTKTERASGITTTDKVNYKTTTDRNIIYNNALDANGESIEKAAIEPMPLKTTTQLVTCDKAADPDCRYGYKVVSCEGEECVAVGAVKGAEWPEAK